MGLGHITALDLAPETCIAGDPAAPRVPSVSSLKPSFSWSQGTFLLSDVQWQSDQVVVFDMCSLLTWPIKLPN